MVVSPESFPPRKSRPSAGSFVSPHLSDHKMIQSLLIISQEISTLQPLKFLLRRNTSSLIRKSQLLSTLFEELLRNQHVNIYPPSAVLCFEELYMVLQRAKALLEDCFSCSKMWLLTKNESVSNTFHELTTELSTLLDIFPGNELILNQDVQELLRLLKRHCLAERKAYNDSHDKFLRSQVLTMLDDIKLQIVPDNATLKNIFQRLNLSDSTSCRDEIESLEDEVSNQEDENSKADTIALIGLVRYSKCVLYDDAAAASTPSTTTGRRRMEADVNIPTDFRCPISLDLMRDPVVVSTGQTYDRLSITSWIGSGHNTCPKTGQTLTHGELIPNCALKNLIGLWCRDQRIPFESTEANVKSNGVAINKTALEAVKMTVAFLVNKLKGCDQAVESIDRVVHELRVLAKTDSDSRACIAEAGALPSLVRFLGSENPSLQVNAVTTILNLSILETNKTRIMETDGVLKGVIEVLRSGATWEAKGNAAATVFSLTSVHAYRKRLGRKTRVVEGLVGLAREGPTSAKRDAMVAILNLACDGEAVGKLMEGGVVDMVTQVMVELREEAMMILEAVVKRGGLMATAATYHTMPKLAEILRDGGERARESVAAILVNICRRGGSHMVAELAAIPGIERVVWEIVGMGSGTARGRRKAATLLRILRRWATGLDNHVTPP